MLPLNLTRRMNSTRWIPALRAQWRILDPAYKFALGAYLVARVALTAWSLAILLLFPVVVQNLDLFGASVLTAFDATMGARYVYSRQLDGATLTFRAGERGEVVDQQTGSVWSLRDGRAVAGKYAGRALAAAPFSAEDVFPYHGLAAETNPLLSVWQRFDANNYLAIAVWGYGSFSGDVHFPPLYPMLIRLLGNSLFAALLISNLALVGALALLYQMAREHFGLSAAGRAVAYLLLFPTAFFLLAAYTEPLFLLLALLSLRAIERRAWLWAGLWTFCAILTRLQGIALVVPLAYALWTTHPWDRKIERVLALTLPELAGLIYLAMRALVGDAAIIPTTEANLSARLVLPWENVSYAIQTLASGKFQAADVLNLLITAVFALSLLAGWRKLPVEWNLYAVASFVVLTMRLVETQPLNSMSRYALSLFPVLVLFGVWGRNAWVNRLIVYSALLLQLWLGAQFFLWGWVA
jgi:Dolichyl-phosphate-mannose-protein mannosyltransferase